MYMARDRARVLGHDTLEILRAGHYRSASGDTVDIRGALDKAARATVSYPPDLKPPAVVPRTLPTDIQVNNETTLHAARRLVSGGMRVVALNFASGTHPGGGFLVGARAQEESLARSSGLFLCLVDNPMYGFHRARHDALSTDYVLYSPDVPVFRTDEGNLLEQPFQCSFLSSPAVNAKALRRYAPERESEILPAMKGRIAKVLNVAAHHGHDTLILGAWGCGAFGNDPEAIAELFRAALQGSHRNVFVRVVFAITDWWEDRRNIGPFRRALGCGLPATG